MAPAKRTLTAAALAVALAGCGGTKTTPHLVPVSVAARAYLDAHPIPPRPGMTDGIITGPSDPWLPISHCPVGGPYVLAGPGYCGAWAVTLMIAPGSTVTVRCGAQAHSIPCRGRGVLPEAGGEIYVPASLAPTSTDQIVVVSQDVLNVQVDGPGDIRAVRP